MEEQHQSTKIFRLCTCFSISEMEKPSPTNLSTSSQTLLPPQDEESAPRRSSLLSAKSDSTGKGKKRVTIHSQTTILLLHDHGTVVVTRDAPYFKRGCRTNVRMVSTGDVITSMIEIIVVIIAIVFALIILNDIHLEGWTRFRGATIYSAKELLHALLVFGFILLFIYLFELSAARKLYHISTDEDMGRKEAIRRARNWRCGNFLMIVLELFFCVCTSIDYRTLVPGCFLLLAGCFRVMGICIVHQFIQEMETVAVTPSAPVIVEHPPAAENYEENVDSVQVVHGHARRKSLDPGKHGHGANAKNNSKTIPSLVVVQDPVQFLNKK